MVQIDFSSYNVGDEDYCGYDYSLSGQLSEVRIVYLNRFVQEVWYLELNLFLNPANSLTSLSLSLSLSLSVCVCVCARRLSVILWDLSPKVLMVL